MCFRKWIQGIDQALGLLRREKNKKAPLDDIPQKGLVCLSKVKEQKDLWNTLLNDHLNTPERPS